MARSFDILFVDDNDVDWMMFREALSEAAPDVSSYRANSGEAAIRFLAKQCDPTPSCPVKLIVLDLNMPGLDGIETLRQLRGSALTGSVPVVVLSSSQSQKDIDRAYWFGANVFLRKPATFTRYVSDLRVLVQHWLQLAQLPAVSLN